MVKLAGIWEVGYTVPLLEMYLWEMVVREFSVDQFYMTPISGLSNVYLTEKATLEEVCEANPNLVRVIVSDESPNDLKDFVHPENALYLFGRVGPDPAPELLRDGDVTVCIKTPTDQGLLWPHQVASILLYDRFLKEQ